MRVLIDSSAWIHALRKNGRPEIRLAVKNCLDEGSACLCEPVLLELWDGARGQPERRFLSELQSTLDIITINEETWSRAYRIAARARSKGLTVPPIDILIFSVAAENGFSILHDDQHFLLLHRIVKA